MPAFACIKAVNFTHIASISFSSRSPSSSPSPTSITSHLALTLFTSFFSFCFRFLVLLDVVSFLFLPLCHPLLFLPHLSLLLRPMDCSSWSVFRPRTFSVRFFFESASFHASNFSFTFLLFLLVFHLLLHFLLLILFFSFFFSFAFFHLLIQCQHQCSTSTTADRSSNRLSNLHLLLLLYTHSLH